VRISGTLTVSVLGDGGRAYLGLEGTDFSLVLAADDFRSESRADADGSVTVVLGPLQGLVAAAEQAEPGAPVWSRQP
jgi:hypothetical protein